MRIAHVSTFPEMRCGIAIYVDDLIKAIPEAEHSKWALHYGKNLTRDSVRDADVSKPDRLRLLARAISESGCDVVSVQHEFGIWGGGLGENIIGFLDELTKPLVATLHTTFDPRTRPPLQTAIIKRLVEQSARTVVLTEASMRLVGRLTGRNAKKVVMIPHGVPQAAFVPAPALWSQAGNANGTGNALSLVSVGFFRPDKGLEEILVAVWIVKRLGIKISYCIAGEPQRQFAGQEDYLHQISGLIKALGLRGAVRVSNTFLTVQEQMQSIRNAHAGIFAYQNQTHSSSGTVPLVLSAGRPVICTPFEYALTKRTELEGVRVADGFGAEAIANALVAFARERRNYRRVTRSLYRDTRGWTWSESGARYLSEFQLAARGA